MGKPPAVSGNSDSGGAAGGGETNHNYLNVEHLHLHGNDLAELRRIAETNPDLAERIIEHRDAEDRREHVSFRLGLVSTAILALAILITLSVLLIWVGIIGTFVSIIGIIAVALLVRVILTGEWSDTSWFGKAVEGLVRLLGGRPTKGD